MKTKTMIVFAIAATTFLCGTTPSMSHRINSKVYDKIVQQHINSQKHNQQNDQQNAFVTNRQRYENSIAYVKASIPTQIFQCMQQLSMLKCMKIFILQRMERTPSYVNSGNLTADFLDQILATKDPESNSIFDGQYMDMDETVMNDRLTDSFQQFFRGREIKLHFVPGMVVRVVPNSENTIKLSVKRGNIFRQLVIGQKI